MDKILADLEDFELPQKVEEEPDESKKVYISVILQDLYVFCKQNENIENLDIKKFRSTFLKKYQAKCRMSKISIKKTDLVLEYNKRYVKNHQEVFQVLIQLL